MGMASYYDLKKDIITYGTIDKRSRTTFYSYYIHAMAQLCAFQLITFLCGNALNRIVLIKY